METLIKDVPFISCKIITYGRVDMLEEMIYSLINQNYPKDRYEIVIVNDCPFQHLVFVHPNVKIYNLKETFKTIGEKENYAIERCIGDLIAVTDDDDIALSNHLENISKYFVPGTNLLHWANAVYFNTPNITALTQTGNSGIVYTKSVWKEIGKSPIMNAGGDMELTETIRKLDPTKIVWAKPENKDISWFYMWGGRGYHQSGMGTDVPGKPNIIQRHSAYIEGLRQQGLIPEGVVNLKPKWKQPYDQLLKDFIHHEGNN